jgi:drug/metabolite transporter (DMT)-like permease
VWKILVLDITSAVLYYMSLEFIGSGMATVLYSFIVVWTALIKRIFFGTKISIGRWISIVAMPCFISLSAVEQVKDNKNSKWRQLIGCILILISSLGYACTFCLNNALLANHAETKKTSSSTRSSSMNESLLNRNQKHDDDDDERDFSVHPTPTHVATIVSMNGLLVLLYMSIFVFPNWSEYMFNDQNKGSTTNAWHYGSTEYTALFYTVFVISVGAHQQSVYHCLCHGASSAVTAGVSKSLQAAGTFMLSALIFCKTEHDQCLNVWKIVGMIGIVFTVLWYSVIDVIIPRRRRDEDDEIVTHLSTPALSVYEGSHSDDDNDDGEA